VNVRDTVSNVLANLLAHSLRGIIGGSFSHDFLSMPVYFFRACAALRGPLRVRALVRVR
jgi:hypothetical protein